MDSFFNDISWRGSEAFSSHPKAVPKGHLGRVSLCASPRGLESGLFRRRRIVAKTQLRKMEADREEAKGMAIVNGTRGKDQVNDHRNESFGTQCAGAASKEVGAPRGALDTIC